MTHSLHRQGTTENLGGDYVVLAMAAKGINEKGAAQKLREFLRIASQLHPVNMGDMKSGNIVQMPLDGVLQACADTSIVHAVFTDIESVRQVLQRLQEAELGVSVVVSGLFAPVRDSCRSLGLHPSPHTVNQSLGVWGRTEMLPRPEVLQISTMCGHGMVSSGLIGEALTKIREGQLGIKEAAKRLAKPCECGIFNPDRAEQLLQQMVAEDTP
jgi:hypothetical protein